MSTAININDAMTMIGLNTLNNGEKNIQLVCSYPLFDPLFDATLLEDLYIESLNGFQTNEVITVSVDGTSLGDFTISADTKAIWFSELTGISRVALNTKVSETIEFTFSTNKLLKFILVSATDVNFLSASTIQTSGLGSNMYKLAQADISASDESEVLAIRDAISKSKTEVTGNNTTTILIKNTYPAWGTALPKTFVMDNLISFNSMLPIASEIYIKKDGVPVKTYTTTANIKNIYLSDMLGISKEFLYQKVNETYELNFIYPQAINNQLITGELTNFTYANIEASSLTQGIFELSNSHSLDNIEVATTTTDFTIKYDDYNKTIKSATLDLGNKQSVNLSFITDNSNPTNPKTLVKLSNADEIYNVQIDLIMDGTAITDIITLLRDFAREQYNKNSTTTSV